MPVNHSAEYMKLVYAELYRLQNERKQGKR